MKKNSIFRWGVAMLLLFTGLSLRAYAEDDGGSPFRKNHDVDLTVKSATLQTFTDAFTKQTGVLFSYESALASMPMGDVSVRESNAPLERILNNVFTKRGFRYKIVDRTVVLTYDRTAEPQRKNSVTGRVCDAAGSPLVGATVLVKDSTRGTTTGADGTYSVEAEPGAVLLFFFVSATAIGTLTGMFWPATSMFMAACLPIATEMGISPFLLSAVLFSAATFGTVLSPRGALVMFIGEELNSNPVDLMKSERPYALIAGGLTAVIYLIMGFVIL